MKNKEVKQKEKNKEKLKFKVRRNFIFVILKFGNSFPSTRKRKKNR